MIFKSIVLKNSGLCVCVWVCVCVRLSVCLLYVSAVVIIIRSIPLHKRPIVRHFFPVSKKFYPQIECRKLNSAARSRIRPSFAS